MRSLVLIFCLLISSSVFADGTPDPLWQWQPIEFHFPAELTNAAVGQLVEKNDGALALTEKSAPQFRTQIAAAVTEFAEMAFRTFSTPIRFPEREPNETPETHLKHVSYVIGKYIKNMEIFSFGQAVLKVAPDLPDHDETTYLYCEQHPEEKDTHFCRFGPGWGNELGWGITRRLLSSSRFVDAVCPVIKPLALWNLNMNSSTLQGRQDVEAFMTELGRILDFVYADGYWSVARLDTFQTPFDSGLYGIVVRRYLDGGPEVIDSARNCLSEIRWAYQEQQPKSDERTTSQVGEILQFQPTAVGAGVTVDLQTTPMNDEIAYRLTHHLSLRQPLPSPVYTFPSNPSDPGFARFGEYLETISYHSGLAHRGLHGLITQLSALDPVYNYRTLNRAEASALYAAGTLRPALDHAFCLIEESETVGDPKFWTIGNGGIIGEDRPWNCELGDAWLVREPKR